MTTYTVNVHNHITEWYLYGKLHREDGPAKTFPDGSTEWYFYDKLHRENGPAKTFPDGSTEWYLNGKLHRTDGPAKTFPDGSTEWYIDNIKLTEDEFNAKTNIILIDGKPFSEATIKAALTKYLIF